MVVFLFRGARGACNCPTQASWVTQAVWACLADAGILLIDGRGMGSRVKGSFSPRLQIPKARGYPTDRGGCVWNREAL